MAPVNPKDHVRICRGIWSRKLIWISSILSSSIFYAAASVASVTPTLSTPSDQASLNLLALNDAKTAESHTTPSMVSRPSDPSGTQLAQAVESGTLYYPYSAPRAGVVTPGEEAQPLVPMGQGGPADPVIQQPVIQEPVVQQPAVPQPVVQQPLFQQPAVQQPAVQQPSTQFAQGVVLTDIQGNWAQSVIEALVARDVIRGFPDGTFRPNAPVTRAQFAAMIRQAFMSSRVRQPIQFVDVPPSYWGYEAIQEAYTTGFLQGYPGNSFQPDQNIPRVQVLVSLTSGLNLSPTADTATILNTYFQDVAQIPEYALNSVAAATENRIVVNYPNVAQLNPNQIATRADVAAFIYQALVSAGQVQPLPPGAIASRYIVGPEDVAQTPPPGPVAPPPQQVQNVRDRLQNLQEVENFGSIFQGSPSITIANPTGFGADNNTIFVGGTFQEETRRSNEADGAAVIGVGVGDARRVVGAELSYTFASFGNNRDFGSGGFNFKLHREFGDSAVAVGWNGFVTIGDDSDLEDSVYGVVSHVVRIRDDISLPLSRLALTAGIGNGQFRTENDIRDDDDTVGVFGSAALRIAQPVSLITEWTGQDLAVGISVVPIRDINWVITPAVRDIAGAGDGARFVLGTGFSFQF